DYLTTDDRHGRSPAASYRDFHLLLRLIGLELPPSAYLALQLAAAAGAGAILLHGRGAGWPETLQVRAVLDLGCGWMTLFGPATESCTYTLLAPTLALAGWQASRPGRSVWTRGLFVAIVALFLGSLILTALPGGKALAFFLNPLAALLLLGERLGSLPRPPRRESGALPGPVYAGRMTLGHGRPLPLPAAPTLPVQGTESLMTDAKSLVSIVCPVYQE